MCLFMPTIAVGWTAKLADERARPAMPQQGQCVKALARAHVQ